MLKENDWRRPADLLRVWDMGEVYRCCCRSEILTELSCVNCGYALLAESAVIRGGKLSAILEALRYL